MHHIISLFSILVFSLFGYHSAYANTGNLSLPMDQETQTGSIQKNTPIQSLDEMQQDINALENQKELLTLGWDRYRNQKGTLTDFLRDNLTQAEKIQLSELLQQYFEEIQQSQNTIDTRIYLFSEIEQYVDEEKKEGFYAYRDMGFSFEIQRQQIETEIQAIQEAKQERTDVLKAKISENAEIRRTNIQNQTEQLVRARLEVFITHESFNVLSDEEKIAIFSRILMRVETQKKELSNSDMQISVTQDRILIFEIVEKTMLEYIDAWTASDVY